MVAPSQGFLLVEKQPSNLTGSANPKYRGIDRLPPWSPADYEQGFDDPYVFDPAADRKLLPRATIAAEFRERFGQVRRPDELEIIFVQLGADQHPEGARFLGFDVAAPDPPFYSLLGDPPAISGIAALLLRVKNTRPPAGLGPICFAARGPSRPTTSRHSSSSAARRGGPSASPGARRPGTARADSDG